MTSPAPDLPPSNGGVPGVGQLSAGRRILLIVIGLAVAVGAWFGVQWVLSVVAPKTSQTSAPAADGFLYVNDDYGFSVTFPGEPTESVQEQSVVGIDLELLQVQWMSGADFSLVQATEFPPELVTQDIETMLVNSISGAASSSGAELSDESSTELDGSPARSANLDFENGDHATVLVAFNGTRQIMLMVTEGASMEALTDSFRFTD